MEMTYFFGFSPCLGFLADSPCLVNIEISNKKV
jgi:hypothetical protein